MLDHSQFDCIIIAVLTHGISGKLYSTDGDLIPVEDLTKYFDGLHCPDLIGKPKVRERQEREKEGERWGREKGRELERS